MRRTTAAVVSPTVRASAASACACITANNTPGSRRRAGTGSIARPSRRLGRDRPGRGMAGGGGVLVFTGGVATDTSGGGSVTRRNSAASSNQSASTKPRSMVEWRTKPTRRASAGSAIAAR